MQSTAFAYLGARNFNLSDSEPPYALQFFTLSHRARIDPFTNHIADRLSHLLLELGVISSKEDRSTATLSRRACGRYRNRLATERGPPRLLALAIAFFANPARKVAAKMLCQID